MTQLPAPKRLAVWAAGTTAVLTAVLGAADAVGAPSAVVAATVGTLTFGAAAVGAAVHDGRQEEARR